MSITNKPNKPNNAFAYLAFDNCKHYYILTSEYNENVACRDCGVYWRKNGVELNPMQNNVIFMTEDEYQKLTIERIIKQNKPIDISCNNCGPIIEITIVDNKTIICNNCKNYIKKTNDSTIKELKNYIDYGIESDYSEL